MADEPDNDTTDDAEDATPPAEGAQDAAQQPAEDAQDASPEQAAPDSDVAGDSEAEPAAEPEPAAEAEAEPVADAEPDSGAEAEPTADAAEGDEPAGADGGEAPTAAAEPSDVVSTKEARRKRRSTHTGEARPQRSPEQRHEERLQERRLKAARRRTRRLAEREKAAKRRGSGPAPEALPPVHAPVQGTRRVRQGVVVSDKAEKTITVRIDIARRHRRYEKIVRSSSTVHAHDENNDAREGDVVRVIESRPISRTKRWALVDVVERAR
jgi:small subunit ribosomal protein S17